MRAWYRNLIRDPKRYAIASAIFYGLWMIVLSLGVDLIRYHRITVGLVIIAAVIWPLGAVFYGWHLYRQRMKQINEGGIEELVRQYEAEQARVTQSAEESERKR